MSAAPRTVDVRAVVCVCRHGRGLHRGHQLICTAGDCDCPHFTPAGKGTVMPRPLPNTWTPPDPDSPRPEPSTIEKLLRRGKASPFKRTAALANKITALVEQLSARLDDEAEDAAQLAVIADLQAKLAAAKAKLNGKHACPDCGKTFATPGGVGPHRSRTHGYRRGTS